jgi:hypothetical protein
MTLTFTIIECAASCLSIGSPGTEVKTCMAVQLTAHDQGMLVIRAILPLGVMIIQNPTSWWRVPCTSGRPENVEDRESEGT